MTALFVAKRGIEIDPHQIAGIRGTAPRARPTVEVLRRRADPDLWLGLPGWIDANREKLREGSMLQAYVRLLLGARRTRHLWGCGFASCNWNVFLPQVRWGGPRPNYIGAGFQTVSYSTRC